MGAKLLDYYEKIGKEFGVTGRFKLALLTTINSTAALTAEDSSANLQKFESAIAKIRQAGKA